MPLKLALYGYDTDIGRLVIETLEEDKELELEDFFPLSPLSGEYDAVRLKKRNYFVSPAAGFDFARADIALFITTPDESSRLADRARERGSIVIDNSRLFSGDGSTLTVLPRINGYELKRALETRLVIPATAPTVQLALSLLPFADEYGLSRVTATLIEAVSERGRLGTETLARETTMLLNGMHAEHEGFPEQVAFNLHTRIGEAGEDGFSEHERVIRRELETLFGGVRWELTCVQAPIFYGHTLCVTADLEKPAGGPREVRELLEGYEDIELSDEVLTPVTHAVNRRGLVLGRLRLSRPANRTVSFVSLMDNSRLGEAVTCVELVKNLAKIMHK